MRWGKTLHKDFENKIVFLVVLDLLFHVLDFVNIFIFAGGPLNMNDSISQKYSPPPPAQRA